MPCDLALSPRYATVFNMKRAVDKLSVAQFKTTTIARCSTTRSCLHELVSSPVVCRAARHVAGGTHAKGQGGWQCPCRTLSLHVLSARERFSQSRRHFLDPDETDVPATTANPICYSQHEWRPKAVPHKHQVFIVQAACLRCTADFEPPSVVPFACRHSGRVGITWDPR